ncbi:MAG: carotenoid oxygenase family protein [Cyanobacteriota bacterium]|nr:carotenoid oxygenase family protein [Cyanobacteriota bacterium]
MTLSAPLSPELSYSHDDWLRGYESQPQEFDYWLEPEDITGTVPEGLRGTLFRNGPGLLEIGGRPIRHPFDGDGLVSAFTFTGDGLVHFHNRFVRTQGYVEEQAAGKMLYRGVFGTQPPGGWLTNAFDLRLKNIANTNIVYWGGKLLALWEAAQPHRLDPQTLETLGLDDLGGRLSPGQAFSAHPRIDPHCDLDGGQPCLVNFSLKSGPKSEITLLEFDPQGQLIRTHQHQIPGFSFIHDFAITPHYALFLQNQVRFNPLPYLFGLRGAGECVQFQADQPARLILIPRRPPYGEPIILTVDAGFVFHHANAWEEGDKVYLDSICYASLPQINPGQDYKQVNFADLDPGQLWRFTVDLSAQTVERRRLLSRCCEFPVLHPQQVGRSYRYLYSGAAHAPIGNAPLQAVIKLDLETGAEQSHSFAPQGFSGEPIFVPRPESEGEDQGWLLVLKYNSAEHRSQLIILNAEDITQAPLATLSLKHHLPYPLHGSWSPRRFIEC